MTKSKVSKLFSLLFAFAFIFVIGNSTASASEALTQEQKEALHKQYVEILDEVKSTVVWGDSLTDIEVAPIENHKDSDWVSPEVFKQRAIDATQANAVELKNTGIQLFGTDSASHKIGISHGNGVTATLTVGATFTTQTVSGRQVFSNYSNLSVTSNTGTWTTTGVDARIIDGGRTFTFNIGGKLTYLNLNTFHTLSTDFLCSSGGAVS